MRVGRSHQSVQQEKEMQRGVRGTLLGPAEGLAFTLQRGKEESSWQWLRWQYFVWSEIH